ncbi:MAG: tRNA (guanosine(46)-N7)-methyltransferase TrmB [Puniceicoccales bacterium]|jgi:tRNA (guanine-N7-)-methyltransferase|nr:tRNA (guanosine(46)-N7)-methyltransferase TrmB [Puniceicoccales bacterium]
MAVPSKEFFADARIKRIATLREHLARQLPDPRNLVLELGCGLGHFLTAYAAAHPEHTCLGIDLRTRRIERALRKRDNATLHNLHFLKADAFELLQALPSVTRISNTFLLFPDPWPKKRHHKNRLIQPRLLDLLATHAAPTKTHLYFRSDHTDYLEWTRTELEKHPAWTLLHNAPWPFEAETYFSQRLPIHQSLVAVHTPEN